MKFLLMCTLALTIAATVSAQNDQEASTKFDKIASKTGTIIKFVDYAMDDISSKYGKAETKVRKLIIGQETTHFYQISKKGKYGTKTASIAYVDLAEVIGALTKLKIYADADKANTQNYIENKYVTDDGFEIGYFVQDGDITWYIKLERHGSDNTVFLEDVLKVETGFTSAKARIDSMRQ